MGLRGDRFKVATCAASTAIWIATCGRPDVADVKKLQRVPSPLRPQYTDSSLTQEFASSLLGRLACPPHAEYVLGTELLRQFLSAATMGQKSQIKLAVSLYYCILTLGQPHHLVIEVTSPPGHGGHLTTLSWRSPHHLVMEVTLPPGHRGHLAT